jgi:uncharacterized protein (DUF4415 family)
MLTTSKKAKIVMPTAAEDAAITAAALADSDAQPLTDSQLKAMTPMRVLRGRPKSSNAKVLVSIRYSPDVLAYFKSLGDGWQANMDKTLQRYVARQRRACA